MTCVATIMLQIKARMKVTDFESEDNKDNKVWRCFWSKNKNDVSSNVEIDLI